MTEFWESVAVSAPGGAARFAAARLFTRVGRAKVETAADVARLTAPIHALTTLVCKAPDARVRSDALRVLERKWEGSERSFHEAVLLGFRAATTVELARTGQRLYDVPATVTGFVVPRVSSADLSRDVASWLVKAFVDSTEDEAVADLAGLLGGTGDPTLLDELQGWFRNAVLSKQHSLLWREGEPTRFTRVLQANPRLPVPPRAQADGTLWDEAPILLAVLRQLPDRARDFFGPGHGAGAVNALVAGATMPAPAWFVAACRRQLRELPPGEPRQVVCRMALAAPSSEAHAAVADAGYLPENERDALAFLFSTEQWARYDRADPDGRLLREYCATYATDYAGDSYRRWLEQAAERAGRPSPCPPLRASTPGRHGPTGSWPTDPGSGGFDGGGGFGGSF
jgi:hypothetical protein